LCHNLKIAIFPDSLKEIKEAAFQECTNLIAIVFSKNLEKIRHYAFEGCSKLSCLEGFESLKIKIIEDNTFRNCKKLKYIHEFPVTLEKIKKSAFERCDNISCKTNDQIKTYLEK